MTMIIGTAVRPRGRRKPFFLIGSDSRKVDVVDVIDGENVLETNEDFQKIYCFGGKLIGFSGALPPEMFEELPKFLQENLLNMEKTCEATLDFVKEYLGQKELPPNQSYWRLTAIIGSVEKGFPQIAKIECDTEYLTQANYTLKNQEQYGFQTEFIGGVKYTKDLQAKFIKDNETKNRNLTYFEVKKFAKEYLTEAVKRYPSSCNSEFKFLELFSEQ